MTGLSQDKLERVGALLAALPGDMAERLCHAARQGDPALARLLDYCRAGPEAAARRRFFASLEDVSGDPGQTRPSRAYAPASLQSSVWRWLAEIAPGVVEAAQAASADFHEDLPGRLDPARVEAAAAMTAALDAVQDDPKRAKKLRARLGVADLEPVRHLANLLRAAPVTRAALAGLPRRITDLSDDLGASLHDRYETASDADPDAAMWVLFLVMARMDRPWRLLRVFERIARRDDDFLVSRTDMAEIGEALLEDAEHYLAGFASPPQDGPQSDRAVAALSEFAAVTVGMTREIGIRKDGAWGKRLFELRNRASEQMIAIHQAARDAFRRATPEEGGLKGRAGAPPKPGEPGHERAVALGRFLIAAKDDAARAAVGNAHQAIIEEIQLRLETLADKLLRTAREGEGEGAQAAAERLEAVAALMSACGAQQTGDVFLRRVAAARAA